MRLDSVFKKKYFFLVSPVKKEQNENDKLFHQVFRKKESFAEVFFWCVDSGGQFYQQHRTF